MKFTTLQPPMFTSKGQDSTREDAIGKGLWIATVNLWLVTENNGGSLIYQRRSKNKAWAPGKLDVAIGGKVDAGEKIETALIREAKEELQLEVDPAELTFLGKNLHVGIAETKFVNTVMHIYITSTTKDPARLKFNAEEIDSMLEIPVSELLKVHTEDSYKLEAKALHADGSEELLQVDKTSFPESWDNYHYKMARIAGKFYKGETGLYY